jgi:hypothetical protein
LARPVARLLVTKASSPMTSTEIGPNVMVGERAQQIDKVLIHQANPP